LFWWYYSNCWTSLIKLSFLLMILLELVTISVETVFCFDDITGIAGHLCLNCLLCWWYYWNCCTSLLKLSFVLMILLELVTISVETVFCFDDFTGIAGHLCLNCLLLWWYYWNCWTSLLKLSFVLMMLLELVTISV